MIKLTFTIEADDYDEPATLRLRAEGTGGDLEGEWPVCEASNIEGACAALANLLLHARFGSVGHHPEHDLREPNAV